MDFPLFGPTPPGARREWTGPKGEGRHLTVALAAMALAWLPMAALAAVEGRLAALLTDPGPHARLLVSLPLLLLTPRLLNPRVAEVSRHFLDSGMVRKADREAYLARIGRLVALRDSYGAHLACVLVAALGALGSAALFGVAEGPAAIKSAWRLNEAGLPSAAAWWHAAVGRPLYYYVQAAFAWRLILWWRYLWGVSRMDLHLTAGHPDGAAGLGFLAVALRGFQLPAFALAAAPAGSLAALILERHADLSGHLYALGAIAVILVAVFAAPFQFFSRLLVVARRRGQLAYADLSDRLMHAFEHRWLAPSRPEPDEMLDRPDFSAAIDLNSVVAQAGRVRVSPLSRTDLLRLAAVALAPFVPVALMEVPVTEVLAEAVKLLL